jgi:hypothetical protein
MDDEEIDFDADEKSHLERRKPTEAALPSVRDPKLWLIKCDVNK